MNGEYCNDETTSVNDLEMRKKKKDEVCNAELLLSLSIILFFYRTMNDGAYVRNLYEIFSI